MQILFEGLNFPEGPAFSPSGELWFVELKGGNLVRCNQGLLERVPSGGAPNGLVFDREGNVLFCDSEKCSVRKYIPAERRFETLADEVDGEALNKPNDLAFDAEGNLIFTCPGESRTEPTGYICCLTPEGTVRKIAEGLYFPNGLALSKDGMSLVAAETYKHRIWKGEWDAKSLVWSSKAVFAETGGPIGPDGMAFDSEGLLYVAVFDTGKLKVFDLEGNQVRSIPLLGNRPTNVAFDPGGRLGLIVTEAEKGLLLCFPEFNKGASLFTGIITSKYKGEREQ